MTNYLDQLKLLRKLRRPSHPRETIKEKLHLQETLIQTLNQLRTEGITLVETRYLLIPEKLLLILNQPRVKALEAGMAMARQIDLLIGRQNSKMYTRFKTDITHNITQP